MKTKLLCSLCVLLFTVASAQVGRFTVTPLEVTAVGNGTSVNIKTALLLDTISGQAYFLMPLSTNPATWGAIGFPPPTTNAATLRLATNATVKVSVPSAPSVP